MDVLGAEDQAASQRIGAATYAVLYAVARSMTLGGAGLVLESNFRRGTSDHELAELVERSRAVFVHCTVSDAVRRQRYATRDRHPGHFDGTVLATWDPDVAVFAPPATLTTMGLTVIEADGAAPTEETVVRIGASIAKIWPGSAT